jgi:hypothetical protein
MEVENTLMRKLLIPLYGIYYNIKYDKAVKKTMSFYANPNLKMARTV